MYPPTGYGTVPSHSLESFNARFRRIDGLVNRLAHQLEDVATFCQLRETLQKNLSNEQATLKVLWYLEAANAAQHGGGGVAPPDRSWQVLRNALTPSVPDAEVLPGPSAEA
jgi:hypothetical protein